jgi:PAS domain S-box
VTSIRKKLQLLLLDGDAAGAEVAVNELRAAGLAFSANLAGSQLQFRELLASAEFDLVISEYQLPDWTAFDALEILKQENGDVPAVLFTAIDSEVFAAECIQRGAVDCVPKNQSRRLPLAVSQAVSDRALRHAQEHVQSALRSSDEIYRNLFLESPEPMWVFDLQTLRFLAVNRAAIRQYGYSQEEFLAMTIADIRPAADVPALHSFLADEIPAREWRHKKKDGTLIQVEVSAHSLEFGGAPSMLAISRDITEQRSLEQQLRQAQKMEAVGRLAGGVAHDFNNLLTIVNSYAELTLGHTADPRLRGYAEKIMNAGERAATLTQQLLVFSRKQVFEARPVVLNRLLEELGKMLPALIGEDIDLTFHLAPDLGIVLADPVHMEQVVMNLVINARDAMPQGGKLLIETSNAEIDEEYARHNPQTSPGEYVLLSVSDTGIGMDAQTKSRLFEPFFTTKEVGRGTGLGLATVYGIVKQAQGFIGVYSELMKGTTFKIYLPRTGSEQAEAVHLQKPLERRRGTETVLLVEDEPALRMVTREVLESLGYTVLECTQGAEALELAKARRAPIDIILTDLVMPGIRGPELAFRIRKLHPEAQTVFMSGYSDRVLQAQELGPDSLFLQKPFSVANLSDKLRAAAERIPAPVASRRWF